MIVNNCNDCTAYMYMQCKFRHNLKALIIEGEHTDKELSEAFTAICIEYLDAAGIEIENVADRTEIAKLQARFLAMQKTIWCQREAISKLGEPFIEALEDFGKYSYSLKWTGDIEKFCIDLDRIEKQEKTFVVQLEDAVAAEQQKEELKKLAGKGKVQEIATEADFVNMLTQLSKFQGYHLKPKEISMLEVAGLVRMLNEANAKTNSN
jgi:hypothetical protein